MLHVIEVRKEAITDTFTNRLTGVLNSYADNPDLIKLPEKETEDKFDAVTYITDALSSTNWFGDAHASQRFVHVTPEDNVIHHVTYLSEPDNHKAVIVVTQYPDDKVKKPEVYVGYNGDLQYATRLTSLQLGINVDQWRFL